MGCCGGNRVTPKSGSTYVSHSSKPKQIIANKTPIVVSKAAKDLDKSQKINKNMKCKCGYPLITTYISNKKRYICSNPNCETRLNVK